MRFRIKHIFSVTSFWPGYCWSPYIFFGFCPFSTTSLLYTGGRFIGKSPVFCSKFELRKWLTTSPHATLQSAAEDHWLYKCVLNEIFAETMCRPKGSNSRTQGLHSYRSFCWIMRTGFEIVNVLGWRPLVRWSDCVENITRWNLE